VHASTYLLLEAKIKHDVGLVKNQGLKVTRVQMALLNHVEHTARCATNHLGTAVELCNAVAHAVPADEGHGGDVLVSAYILGYLGGLHGELASG